MKSKIRVSEFVFQLLIWIEGMLRLIVVCRIALSVFWILVFTKVWLNWLEWLNWLDRLNLSNGLGGILESAQKRGYLPDNRNPPLAPETNFILLVPPSAWGGASSGTLLQSTTRKESNRTEPGFVRRSTDCVLNLANRLCSQIPLRRQKRISFS